MGRVKELAKEFEFVNQIEKPNFSLDFFDLSLEEWFNIKIKE